jgi:hypothetical protein
MACHHGCHGAHLAPFELCVEVRVRRVGIFRRDRAREPKMHPSSDHEPPERAVKEQ